MSQLIAAVTALPGGFIDTRFFGDILKRKRIMLLSQIIGVPLGIFYLFRVPFTVVVLISAWGGLTGGLLAPVTQAFRADCLPHGPDGRPTDPTRDTLIWGWAGYIPGIFIPVLGGKLFAMGASRQTVYHYMFVWQVQLPPPTPPTHTHLPSAGTVLMVALSPLNDHGFACSLCLVWPPPRSSAPSPFDPKVMTTTQEVGRCQCTAQDVCATVLTHCSVGGRHGRRRNTPGRQCPRGEGMRQMLLAGAGGTLGPGPC